MLNEKWLKNQWVEQYERGKYRLTDYGKVVVDVF
jgi:ribosomal silencing factor RsfS